MFLDLQVGDLIEPLTGRRWIGRPYCVDSAHGPRISKSRACRIPIRSSCITGTRSNFSLTFWRFGSLGGCAVRSITG